MTTVIFLSQNLIVLQGAIRISFLKQRNIVIFSERVINVWNNFPSDNTVDFSSFARFKNILLYLSPFLITWYNHLNSELILFIRSI